MSNLIHQRRLHQLRQLLLNLIYGYYNYRIPVVSTQTYLETLVRLANTLADTLDKKTSHTQNLIKGVILLSMDWYHYKHKSFYGQVPLALKWKCSMALP